MTTAEEPRQIPDRATLTFIGRLAENKGWQTFIQALGRLPKEWQSVLVGPLTDGLKNRAQNLANQVDCAAV